MSMATVGLPEKFGVARHKIVFGGGEGDQPKSAHVQQVISIIIHWVKEGLQFIRAKDLMDICTVSVRGGYLGSSNPHNWSDDSEINIWVDWDHCTKELGGSTV